MTRPFGERFRRQAAGGDPFSESASFCNGWAGILGFEGGDSGSDSSNNNNNNNNNNG